MQMTVFGIPVQADVEVMLSAEKQAVLTGQSLNIHEAVPPPYRQTPGKDGRI